MNPRKRPAQEQAAAFRQGESARIFWCVLCRSRAVVCRSCDRGQIYCGKNCATEARRRNQREARCRYQTSACGRATHAERSRRHRARHRHVTDHGSKIADLGQLVAPQTLAAATTTSASRVPALRHRFHCSRCACPVSELVRRSFLVRRRRPSIRVRPHWCGHEAGMATSRQTASAARFAHFHTAANNAPS
jgi:hypothetical protein